MRQKTEIQKGAARYLVKLLFQRIIGIALFFIAAGTFSDLRSAVNLLLYMVISIIACVLMLNGHQETLSERGKRQKNTKSWDKVLLPIYVLLAYYAIYFTAGIGVRYRLNQLPIGWFYAGTAIYLISGIFTVWPVLENKHFESTSRIQGDRLQTVIRTGPYKIVRHPGYMGIILWSAAVFFMFGTVPVGIMSFIIIVIIWIRTFLEDKMLKNELDGYRSYSEKVKYRLFHFIW